MVLVAQSVLVSVSGISVPVLALILVPISVSVADSVSVTVKYWLWYWYQSRNWYQYLYWLWYQSRYQNYPWYQCLPGIDIGQGTCRDISRGTGIGRSIGISNSCV